jgi:hypothetical protein
VRQEKRIIAKRLAEEERMLMMMHPEPPQRILPGRKARRAEPDSE